MSKCKVFFLFLCKMLLSVTCDQAPRRQERNLYCRVSVNWGKVAQAHHQPLPHRLSDSLDNMGRTFPTSSHGQKCSPSKGLKEYLFPLKPNNEEENLTLFPFLLASLLLCYVILLKSLCSISYKRVLSFCSCNLGPQTHFGMPYNPCPCSNLYWETRRHTTVVNLKQKSKTITLLSSSLSCQLHVS